ncbi:MAG TPA: hypothetical protein VNL38_02710 [Candidatus Nitrosotenuis sp.]|nr:hypothetical protein [Candidatus Nitrosotenuis sp.]
MQARKKSRHMIRLLALLAALLAAAAASATTLVRMSLEEMAAAASAVARVKCLSSTSRWEGGQIFTFTTFEVLETLKGSVPRSITVRLVGGQVAHIRAHVDGVPRFTPGEEAYLFLEPTTNGELTVTSWAQGTFRVRQVSPKVELVTQDTGGLSIFDPQTRQFRAGGVRNLPVAEFRQRVSDAIERAELRRKSQ